MIRIARRAPALLGEDSSGLVRAFILSQQNAGGGFQDREGRADLYYTVFGLQSLLALGQPIPSEPLRGYLTSFNDGEGLDFVHLCCLGRCWALLGPNEMGASKESLLRRIEAYRLADGGYHPRLASPNGTAYAAFLALGAYQDLELRLPNPPRLSAALRLLATNDGAWANERPAKIGSTNSTAAAIGVLGAIQPLAVRRQSAQWLLAQAHPLGGFRASPLAPIPDLLSTATALHTLGALGCPLEAVREGCLDFIDTLWSNQGGFHGHWNDDLMDVEYTFYGLLALGQLANKTPKP